MHRLRTLSEYPDRTLDAVRGIVTELLGYQDMLPTDLYVKLDLFRDDIGAAIRLSARRSPALTQYRAVDNPHPGRRPR